MCILSIHLNCTKFVENFGKEDFERCRAGLRT